MIRMNLYTYMNQHKSYEKHVKYESTYILQKHNNIPHMYDRKKKKVFTPKILQKTNP